MHANALDSVPQIVTVSFARELNFSTEARSIASDACSATELFQRLCRGPLFADAIRLLPHLLPRRRAAWWACLCIWQAHRHEATPEAANALDAAVQWIARPTEVNRRACEAAAQLAGLETSAGCVAMAAFWSGGSMSRPELPPVAPPPTLAAKVISGAVLLAAAEREPLRFEQHYEDFLAWGEQVARGKLLWTLPEESRQEVDGRRWRLDSQCPLPSPHMRHSTVIAAAGWHPQEHHYAEQSI